MFTSTVFLCCVLLPISIHIVVLWYVTETEFHGRGSVESRDPRALLGRPVVWVSKDPWDPMAIKGNVDQL